MKKLVIFVFLLLAIAGCATAPVGPSVLVLQGSGKTFDEFSRDDVACRDYAMRQLGGKSPGKTAQDSTVNSAVIGTSVGAAAGAALGGSNGAAVGAGTGLLFGSVAGADSGRYERGTSQTMYDHAYIQCMYGAGHRVPVPAGMFSTEQRSAPKAPPPGAPVPPPPTAPPPPAAPR
jgi:hypothetical protein